MNLILLATGSLVNVRGRVLFLCVFAFFSFTYFSGFLEGSVRLKALQGGFSLK